MEALANIRRVSSNNNNHSTPQPQQHHQPPPPQQSLPQYPPASAPPPVQVPGMPFPFPQLPQVQAQAQAPAQPSMPAAGFPQGFPGMAPGGAPPNMAGGGGQNQMQSVMLIKTLVESGVPADKIPAIVAGLSGMQNNNGAPGSMPQLGQTPYGGSWGGQDGYQQPPPRGYDQPMSPGGYHNRSRSRSPPRQWGSGRGRDRDYGGYGEDSPGRMDDRNRRGRGSEYRQRSPPGRHDRTPSPPETKWVDYEHNIPAGSIKVLSRTLFVGGVT